MYLLDYSSKLKLADFLIESSATEKEVVNNYLKENYFFSDGLLALIYAEKDKSLFRLDSD